MSYASLMKHLSSLCRNIVAPEITMMAPLTPTQQQAFDLLGLKVK